MSIVLKSLAVLLLHRIVVESTKCRSAFADDLTLNEIEFCWSQFCLCNQFDNCTEFGRPVEDVLVLIQLRLGAVLCGRNFAKIFEPNGHHFDMNFIATKQTEELFRFTISYKSFRRSDQVRSKSSDPEAKYPPSLLNPFWGYRFNTSALIEGHFSFTNSYKKLLKEDDKYTVMDPVYYILNYWIRYKHTFNGNETLGVKNTLLLGPFGRKALIGRQNMYSYMAFPPFHISEQLAFKLRFSEAFITSDFVEKEVFITWVQSKLDYHICVGKTIDKKSGLTYWTSEGCHPVLKFSDNLKTIRPNPTVINSLWMNQVECQCDWNSNPPSMPLDSDYFEKSAQNDGLIEETTSNYRTPIKRNNTVLTFGWVLFTLSCITSFGFTIFLILNLIE